MEQKATGSESEANSSQLDKFKALARELEADEDETRWDERLKKVVAQKPAPPPEENPS